MEFTQKIRNGATLKVRRTPLIGMTREKIYFLQGQILLTPPNLSPFITYRKSLHVRKTFLKGNLSLHNTQTCAFLLNGCIQYIKLLCLKSYTLILKKGLYTFHSILHQWATAFKRNSDLFLFISTVNMGITITTYIPCTPGVADA